MNLMGILALAGAGLGMDIFTLSDSLDADPRFAHRHRPLRDAKPSHPLLSGSDRILPPAPPKPLTKRQRRRLRGKARDAARLAKCHEANPIPWWSRRRADPPEESA